MTDAISAALTAGADIAYTTWGKIVTTIQGGVKMSDYTSVQTCLSQPWVSDDDGDWKVDACTHVCVKTLGEYYAVIWANAFFNLFLLSTILYKLAPRQARWQCCMYIFMYGCIYIHTQSRLIWRLSA